MHFPVIANMIIGGLNGYNLKNGGLPNPIKYTTLSLATMFTINNILSKPNILNGKSSGVLMFSFLVGVPFMNGAVFCLGNQVGKAIEYVEKPPKSLFLQI
jgi:hypothetical protein